MGERQKIARSWVVCGAALLMASGVCAGFSDMQAAEIRTQPPAEVQQVQTQVRYIDPDSREILKRIAMAEAEGESTRGKALVMMVVLNRTEAEGFPDTVEEVVFQRLGNVWQFTPVRTGGRYWSVVPDEDCEEAVRMIESGWDESYGATYIDAVNSGSWQSQHCTFLFQDGGHRFWK